METSREGKARAAGSSSSEIDIEATLRRFVDQLSAALDSGLSAEQTVQLLGEVDVQARLVLEEIANETGVGGGSIGGMLLARDIEGLLVRQHGWITPVPGTVRVIAGETGRWLSLAPGDNIPFGPDRMVVPMADICAIKTNAEALGEGPTVPEPCPFAEGDRVRTTLHGEEGTVAAVPDPGKMVPVLIDGQETPYPIAVADLTLVEPKAPPFDTGQLVRVPGGSVGEVLSPADPKGRIPVQIDGGDVQSFLAGEMELERPAHARPEEAGS